MNKKIIFLLLSQFIGFQMLSQVENQQIDNRSTEKNILDKITFRVTYLQTGVSDILNPENKKENIMLLEVGENISKYFDQQVFMVDSLREVHANSKINVDKSSKIIVPLLRGSISEVLFKNFPENKITVTDRIPFDTYRYEENVEIPNWKLADGHLTVCGYECKKALTTFRGRNYIAWYTPEISISEGPWKFSGLPGLILKIEDDRKHYSFVCIGIMRPKNENIYFSLAYRYRVTSKEKFRKGLADYYKNPGAHIQNSGFVKSEIPPHVYKARPYNPIELSE